MKISCFIISYLGDYPDIRERRIKMHLDQLCWLRCIPAFNEIHVLYMRYSDDELQQVQIDDTRIKQHIFPNKMPQGHARNILLKDFFYNSDNDYGLFLDDDSILYDHFSGKNFFSEISKIDINRFSKVDVIVPIDPRQEPFTNEYKKRKNIIDNNIVLEFFSSMKTSFFLIKNFPKFSKDPMFFDNNFIMLEDQEFAVQLVYKGYTLYKSKNIVLKELGNSISSLPYEQNGGRKAFNDVWSQNIFEKWKLKGMQQKDTKVLLAAFIRKHFKLNFNKIDVIIPKGKEKLLNKFL